MSIHRITRRSVTGQDHFCQECEAFKHKGFWFLWSILSGAVFVCDDCLSLARRVEFVDGGKPQHVAGAKGAKS